MKTKISKNNPFGCDRYGFLWEVLCSRHKGVHLDYGTYDGKVLKQLSETDLIKRGVGLDLNRKIIASNYSTMPSNVVLENVSQKTPLPHYDSFFDTISILDVIEHIHDQESILKELNRVLKNDGILIVTVPKKHAFSFLDTGNFKFYFPQIYRWYYVKKYSLKAYKERYIDCPNGLFGDIEKKKMWHQHFSCKEMENLLLKCGFKILVFDGSGFLCRVLWIVDFLVPRFLKRFTPILTKMDARLFSSVNLFCVATKQNVSQPG